MPKKVKKEPVPKEPYWTELVQTWYKFYRLHFTIDPSFDGSAPRDLKNIVIQLRTRCEKSNQQWDEISSQGRLWLFLKTAYDIPWLQSHFTLFNINRQKDIVFQNAVKSRVPEKSIQ